MRRPFVRQFAFPLVVAAVLPGAALPFTHRPELPPSALAVETRDGWRVWWQSARAPGQWRAADPHLLGAIRWQRARAGLEWGQLRLAGDGEAWRIGVVVVRIDPSRFDFSVAVRRVGQGRAGSWAITDADSSAVLALNAGQFVANAPWGWVVHQGRERRPPGQGPLAPAIVVDSSGRLRFVSPDSIAGVRSGAGVREAFQSYPMLLVGDGDIPLPLSDTGRGVDLVHRDSRLAIGELRDGHWIVALTRFEGLGGVLTRLPFGLTAPEMAALMGALGARQAVMLDGGISGQLLLRDSTGHAHLWSGMRRVPMGWTAHDRPD